MKGDLKSFRGLKTSKAQLLVELSNRLAGLSFGIIRSDHDDWIIAPPSTLYEGAWTLAVDQTNQKHCSLDQVLVLDGVE